VIECPVCGNTVPDGEFCGACGAHLTNGSSRRLAAYAPHPSEHVLQPSVVSTLFPNLPHRHGVHFRIALLVVAVLLAVLGIFRVTGPAIAVAAGSMPLLYVLYLLEFHLRGRDPLPVIAVTFGLGVLLGIPWALATGPLVTRALIHNAVAGVSPASLLVEGVILRLIAQALMLVGAAILFLRWRHRQPLDGFAFGVAGALGFVLTTTLVNLAPEMRHGLVVDAPASVSLLQILGRGLLIPFLNGSTTGLIALGLWQWRLHTRPLPLSWTHSLALAAVGALLVQVALGVLDVTILHPAWVVAVYVAIAAILLMWVRVALHSALLARQPEAVIGDPHVCHHCHRWVPRMAYCPHCGAVPTEPDTPAPSRPDDVVRAGPFRPATQAEVDEALPRPHPVRRWGALGTGLAASAVVLGVVGLLLTPATRAACRTLCAPPPPPCLGFSCRHVSSAPPLKSSSTYTSSAFGFSVNYSRFSPSSEDAQSVEWDLSAGSGQYTVVVTAGRANGRGADRVVRDVVNSNFPDYSGVYSVPGAEVGYVPGSGAVYDEQVASFFGSAADTRLVVMASVRGGLTIVVVGDGDAASSSGDHPDPSGLPVSSFLDTLTNGTRWPGQPPT
jgi:hypothetical protein